MTDGSKDDLSLSRMLDILTRCVHAPAMEEKKEHVAVREAVYGAFSFAHMPGTRRLRAAKVQATRRSASLELRRSLHQTVIHAYAFAQMYSVLFPCMPLHRIGIHGDLPAVGMRDGCLEAVLIIPAGLPSDYEVLAPLIYPELDLYAGIAADLMSQQTVRGRIFYPRSGSSIVVPCSGDHYYIARALYDRNIMRRGCWCNGCPLGCSVRVESRVHPRELQQVRRRNV